MAVLVAFGSNLKTSAFPAPLETVRSAIAFLEAHPAVSLQSLGRFYETEPIPKSDQAWFVNTVAMYQTSLAAEDFLAWCHQVEDRMGRERSIPNAARVIDIDLIDFDGQTQGEEHQKHKRLVLPHPAAHQRAFVLRPLMDVMPNWKHPTLQKSAKDLLAELPEDQALGQGIRNLSQE